MLKNAQRHPLQITLARRRDIGLLSLRGTPAVLGSALAALGLDAPDQRKITRAGANLACWMSPDEILLVVPRGDLDRVKAGLTGTLAGQHHLIHDITQGRTVLHLTGPNLREILAKACPVDLHPQAFALYEIRRTRAGQVNVAFWLEAQDRAVVISARSVGDYLETLLKTLARSGSEVGLFDKA